MLISLGGCVNLTACHIRYQHKRRLGVTPAAARTNEQRHSQFNTTADCYYVCFWLQAVDITVVTSTTEITRKLVRRHEILLPFHYHIVSTFIHSQMPQPRVYNLLVRQLQNQQRENKLQLIAMQSIRVHFTLWFVPLLPWRLASRQL
jgi:hypothetical protein